MTINEVVDAKFVCEDKILAAINEFESVTGFFVDDIEIQDSLESESGKSVRIVSEL
jgi:hypothetical protein